MATHRRTLAELITEGLDAVEAAAMRHHARTPGSSAVPIRDWRRGPFEMYAVRGIDRPAPGTDRLDSRSALLSVWVVNPTGTQYEIVRVRFRDLLNADGTPCDHREIGREIIENLTVVSDDEVRNLLGDEPDGATDQAE